MELSILSKTNVHICNFNKNLYVYLAYKNTIKEITNSSWKEEKGVWPWVMNGYLTGRHGRTELYKKKKSQKNKYIESKTCLEAYCLVRKRREND